MFRPNRILTALFAFSVLSLSGCGYNQFQQLDENVKAQWSEVVNQYQRRADLTPGKMVFKMKVVNEDYSKIDLFTALKRVSVEGVLQGALALLAINMFLTMQQNFAFANMMDFAKAIQVGPYHTVNMLEAGWDYVGIMSCLFTIKRKAVHDFIAGTIVIRRTDAA